MIKNTECNFYPHALKSRTLQTSIWFWFYSYMVLVVVVGGGITPITLVTSAAREWHVAAPKEAAKSIGGVCVSACTVIHKRAKTVRVGGGVLISICECVHMCVCVVVKRGFECLSSQDKERISSYCHLFEVVHPSANMTNSHFSFLVNMAPFSLIHLLHILFLSYDGYTTALTRH